MKSTAIYLTKDEKKKAVKICQNYHVSLSALVDKIAFEFYYALIHNKKEDVKIETFTAYYLLEYAEEVKLNQKTTIKVRTSENYQQMIKPKNLSIYYTNVLKVYINKRVGRYINEKGYNKFYNRVDKKLQETKEEYYDYNNFIRKNRRMLREQKEYYKRAIASMEANDEKTRKHET